MWKELRYLMFLVLYLFLVHAHLFKSIWLILYQIPNASGSSLIAVCYSVMKHNLPYWFMVWKTHLFFFLYTHGNINIPAYVKKRVSQHFKKRLVYYKTTIVHILMLSHFCQQIFPNRWFKVKTEHIVNFSCLNNVLKKTLTPTCETMPQIIPLSWITFLSLCVNEGFSLETLCDHLTFILDIMVSVVVWVTS